MESCPSRPRSACVCWILVHDLRRQTQQPRHRQRGGILGSLAGLLFIIVFCAVIYLARRPILRFAGESWVVEDPLEHADAILVLSDDNFFADRATRASELFRQKLAPVIVASGRRLRPNAGIAELMEHDLVERGVPRKDIIRFRMTPTTPARKPWPSPRW